MQSNTKQIQISAVGPLRKDHHQTIRENTFLNRRNRFYGCSRGENRRQPFYATELSPVVRLEQVKKD